MAGLIRLEGNDVSNGVAADRLINLVQRVERLEEEKRALTSDIADIYKEAKSAGFDPKVMRAMIRERRMAESEREEWQALCDVYRAALGMLAGTPLGEAARKRFMPPPPAESGEDIEQAEAEPTVPAEASAEDLLSARAAGAAAAKEGRKVTENPHAAGDPRRAAWDEGWCGAAGSDGMDIPPAFRRATPRKGKPSGKGAGA
jgi:uncharacterized protein (UPF0335 family)